MFTDMVGYTALMQQDEALALEYRTRHRDVLEIAHAAYHGEIIQYFGDGTLSIFSSAVEAIEAARYIQTQLRIPPEIPLRIGLHLGDVIQRDDGIIGDGVNVASRIESFAIPGSVLFSDSVFEQVKNQGQFSFKSLGTFHLKNVTRPVDIFALVDDRLIVPKPEALRGKGERRNTSTIQIPRALSSFVGREHELHEVKEFLTEHRLVTLTGPGGIGKTRLAQEIGVLASPLFPEGVYWVDLAAVL